MKHEDFYDRYNDVMFDEREVIEKFLKEQSDIRYGQQMYEWAFRDPVAIMMWNGNVLTIEEMKLDYSTFVLFRASNGAWYECSDFAYGQLSEIIDALPEVDDIKRKNIDCDLYRLTKEYKMLSLLKEYPIEFTDGVDYTLTDVFIEDDKVKLKAYDGGITYGILSEIDLDTYKKIADHIKKSILHCSDQYKQLKGQLNQFGGNLYNFAEKGEVGKVTITPWGTDLELPVLDVSMEDGELEILVSVKDTRIALDGQEDLLLKESDLTPSNLDDILKFFIGYGVMDETNGHNEEIVRKINMAWSMKKYHEKFGDILYAFWQRDKEEIKDRFDIVINDKDDAMIYAREILQGCCDDWDLETVLGFVRYEEK